MCCCLLFPTAAPRSREISSPPPPTQVLMLAFQLSATASSNCRHPSYFKHSGAVRWKHVRNLDDWPSTPPPSTPSIPALCYLLSGRRGQRRPGCLDEVITAYQWHCGGRPADLPNDASWAKNRGCFWGVQQKKLAETSSVPMIRITCSSLNTLTTHLLYYLYYGWVLFFHLALHVSLHVHCHSCRGATVYGLN